MNYDKIPDVLKQNRESVECAFIFSLYQDPSLMEIYKDIQNDRDILTSPGKFYYGIAVRLKERKCVTFDETAIYTFIDDKPSLKQEYTKYGGYQYIQEFSNTIDPANIEAYYDALSKSNLLIRFHNAGFPVIENYSKFSEMSCEQVYDYYDYMLANITLNKIDKINVENLSEGYEEYIESWRSGSDMGYTIGSGLLNSRLLGIHKKNLTLHLAGIGSGKTSTAIAWYILPAIEHAHNICIIANEQDQDAWRKMILATVMFSKINKMPKCNRQDIARGGFSDEVVQSMILAQDWIMNQPGKISFVDLPSYDIGNVRKVIKSEARKGTPYFILDTMKSFDDSAENNWGQFSEMAKELFQLAKNLDVAVIATCQLSPEAMSKKFLDLTCVGRARQISEVANAVVMFRHLTREDRAQVKPYRYERMGSAKVKKELSLDVEKDYIMVFTPKNRYGAVNPQIIMECDLNYNTYSDVGYYDCPFDIYKK